VDLSSPAIEQFPQVFTPCPAGAVPASDVEAVAAVDAAVQGLLGACVRVTRQVVPVQTTIVVLDQNLIDELEAAGVPLQQLVVPCPTNGGGAAGPGAGPGAGTGGTSGGGTVTGASSSVGSTLPGRLAFTGGDLIRLGLAGALLLALGLACTRRALALSAVAGRG
jgi:hypothetical protein